MSETKLDTFEHVTYLWDDAHADTLDPVERLVYRSNLLGQDQRITNTGGGNTSSKLIVTDPLTGKDEEVMFVKGSGGDLRTSERENFASLYMDKLEALKTIYDTSKAAANHLVRELAVELAPLVRVNGLAPATVVEGSGMFPRERVISSLTKYAIGFSENDDTETLRDKLAHFYAQRTLTKTPITLADQAEGAYLLASGKLGKTTGQILSVDGGLHEAFLR